MNATTIPSDPGITLPDLTPRGTTRIDLGGRMVACQWTPWGCCYTTLTPREGAEREALGLALKEAGEFARSVRTVAHAEAVLRGLGAQIVGGKLRTMRVEIEVRLLSTWFPNEFINEKVATSEELEVLGRVARGLGPECAQKAA